MGGVEGLVRDVSWRMHHCVLVGWWWNDLCHKGNHKLALALQIRSRLQLLCDSLQACSTVNQSKVYIPAEGRIECIRVVSLVCL